MKNVVAYGQDSAHGGRNFLTRHLREADPSARHSKRVKCTIRKPHIFIFSEYVLYLNNINCFNLAARRALCA